jgi:plasmid stabilization system protein ParE
MRVRFHPEARAEFKDAALYYGQHEEGLGDRFVDAVESAIQSIQEAPQRWSILVGDVRRRLVRVFPYAILYTIEAKSIHLQAIMHLHRKPAYWESRSTG